MNNSIKISVISDNRSKESCFITEHGLSVYLETESCKYLLDTGAGDILLKNAFTAGIDLSDIDYVFISHGHSDHTGGIDSILKLNSKCKIVMSDKIAGHDFYSLRNEKRYIGTSLDFKKYLDRIVFVDAYMEFDDFFVFNPKHRSGALPKANELLYDGLDKDKFDHELIFCLKGFYSLLFSGCAHTGILNILDYYRQICNKNPMIVIGGFHLPDSKLINQYEIQEDILNLGKAIYEQYPETKFITGHCTGDNAYETLKLVLRDNLDLLYAGFKLIL